VEEEEVMIVAVVMRNQTLESYGIQNHAKKLMSLVITSYKSRQKIEKEW